MGKKNVYHSWKVSERIRNLKKQAVDYKGGGCSQCGYSKCLASLAFHHLDPLEKDFQISGKCTTWEKLKVEVDKCICLCHNCHTELHDAERQERMVERERQAREVVSKRVVREVFSVQCQCGTIFKARKSNRPNARFCSKVCSVEGRVKGNWPSDQNLLSMIDELGVSETARRVGVVPKTIRLRRTRILGLKLNG